MRMASEKNKNILGGRGQRKRDQRRHEERMMGTNGAHNKEHRKMLVLLLAPPLVLVTPAPTRSFGYIFRRIPPSPLMSPSSPLSLPPSPLPSPIPSLLPSLCLPPLPIPSPLPAPIPCPPFPLRFPPSGPGPRLRAGARGHQAPAKSERLSVGPWAHGRALGPGPGPSPGPGPEPGAGAPGHRPNDPRDPHKKLAAVPV